ncbi:helix-turn-helix domain-containing protein [Desulfospira joergensenii]|uniref:helix-turn-helix domain-containing protein n=1 Tax=Desulfospira joergensenii TaxID=53329 RepID=UPI0003B42B8C|nr:helix-turn-helix transcriptional regulator [Desulfospira joergensenii]
MDLENLRNRRQEKRSARIRELLNASQMPRNQVASISGISNTYIRDLENGNIVNVSRTKLISLSVALNLGLHEIDRLLNDFERTALSSDDIPVFIETSGQSKFSQAMLPVRDRFTLDLMMLSAERIPGNLTVVSSRPTHSIRAEGHPSYTERFFAEAHPIYPELIESIGRERKRHLTRNLTRFKVNQYICKTCLEEYIHNCTDKTELEWRCRHIENLIWHLKNYENFNAHITCDCPTFMMVLKESGEADGSGDKLLMTYLPPHPSASHHSGRFVGFATENSNVIRNFRDDLYVTHKAVIQKFTDKSRLIDFLQTLIKGY